MVSLRSHLSGSQSHRGALALSTGHLLALRPRDTWYPVVEAHVTALDGLAETGLQPEARLSRVTLVDHIPEEVVLQLVDSPTRAHNLAHNRKLAVDIRLGGITTPWGPVLQVFVAMTEVGSREPHTLWVHSLNPHNPNALRLLDDFVNQSCWHVLFSDTRGQVVSMRPLSNDFTLAERLDALLADMWRHAEIDFERACSFAGQMTHAQTSWRRLGR